jgi:hypothetical protein
MDKSDEAPNTDKVRVWTRWHPLMLHAQINPGMAINELVLGQAMPSRIVIHPNDGRPLADRQSIDCPHCMARHNSLIWRKTGFGNWYGIYCPQCEENIPRLFNALSALVMLLTWPIWRPFKNRIEPVLKRRQLAKLRNPSSAATITNSRKHAGLKMGLMWGAMMFGMFSSWLWLNGEMTLNGLFGQLLGWGVAGAVFGFSMWFFLLRSKPRKSAQD